MYAIRSYYAGDPPDPVEDGPPVEPVRFIVKIGPEGRVDKIIDIASVITSYSIHYTKLYDYIHHLPACPLNPGGPQPGTGFQPTVGCLDDGLGRRRLS